MAIKDNITKKQADYMTIIKEPIFEIDANYVVTTNVTDLWEQNNQLFVELTLNEFQKSILKITDYQNFINLKYYQKEIFKARYYDKTFKNLNLNKLNYEVLDNEIKIHLQNNEFLIIQKKPFQLSLYDNNNKVKIQTSLRQGWDFLEGFCTPPLGFKRKLNTSKPFMSLQLQSDELIYGLGEKFTNFVKNGNQSVIYNTDNGAVSNGEWAYAGVPLVYSTKNWGLLLNTSYKTTWEIGSPITESLVVMSDEECLDMVLFTGNSIKDLISQYTSLTGRINGVPDEGYGIWVNRLYYHNKKELFTEIDNSIKHKYPIDIFTLDPKWLRSRFTKGCNFEFNVDQFGDPKELFKDVHDKGFKMCFWMNPYLQIDNGETWKEAFENGYYVKKADGSIAHIWASINYYQETATAVDLTNPKAYEWWKEKIKKYLKMGLDFIKTDYGDSIDEDALFYNGETGKNFKNGYAELYLKAAYEAATEVLGEGKVLSLARSGYIGSQKYVGKWGGDSATSFNELKMQLWAGLSSSLNGVVMWGTDIGGFENLAVHEKDLYARWSQFGLLTPFSRYHGRGPREPWYFGKQDFEISKKFALLKRQLLPYYKVYEKQSIETGLPILRPLVLEFQDDIIAQKIDNQFMLGENLMVAPILVNEQYKRQVYFPKGEWIDFFDKTVYEGNRVYEIDCSIDKTLIFVKSGYVIPVIENGYYRYENLDNEKINLMKFGNIENQTLNFKLNDVNYEIEIKKNIVTKTNKSKLAII